MSSIERCATLPWGVIGIAVIVSGGAGCLLVFVGIAVFEALVAALLARIMLSRVERQRDTRRDPVGVRAGTSWGCAPLTASEPDEPASPVRWRA